MSDFDFQHLKARSQECRPQIWLQSDLETNIYIYNQPETLDAQPLGILLLKFSIPNLYI